VGHRQSLSGFRQRDDERFRGDLAAKGEVEEDGRGGPNAGEGEEVARDLLAESHPLRNRQGVPPFQQVAADPGFLRADLFG
jgi:hypothetical protein